MFVALLLTSLADYVKKVLHKTISIHSRSVHDSRRVWIR